MKEEMEHRFNIRGMLESLVGYKGLPFPGVFAKVDLPGGYIGDKREVSPMAPKQNIRANKGAILARVDKNGSYYFMPVTFMHQGKSYEIDCALISITGKKNIITTALVGQKGSVRELINIEDYKINIVGAVIGEDGQWPEEKLDDLNELFTINEAIELKCALTDIFFQDSDKVVITDLNFPAATQIEHVQIVEIQCETDKPFELILK
ncbi:MAG: DUF6046 domain-containing protein [Bacteroidales bacterium]